MLQVMQMLQRCLAPIHNSEREREKHILHADQRGDEDE